MTEEQVRERLIQAMKTILNDDTLVIEDCWKASAWKWKIDSHTLDILYFQVKDILHIVDTLHLTFAIAGFKNHMTFVFLPMEDSQ